MRHSAAGRPLPSSARSGGRKRAQVRWPQRRFACRCLRGYAATSSTARCLATTTTATSRRRFSTRSAKRSSRARSAFARMRIDPRARIWQTLRFVRRHAAVQLSPDGARLVSYVVDLAVWRNYRNMSIDPDSVCKVYLFRRPRSRLPRVYRGISRSHCTARCCCRLGLRSRWKTRWLTSGVCKSARPPMRSFKRCEGSTSCRIKTPWRRPSMMR